jgi:hypothetical protein
MCCLRLQKTRYEFSNLLFKVSNHDHTACRSGQRNEPAKQCLPAQHGAHAAWINHSVGLCCSTRSTVIQC